MQKASRSVSLLVTAFAVALVAISIWLLRTSPSAVAEQERQRVASGEAPVANEAPPPPSATVDSVVVTERGARIEADISGVLEPLRSVIIGAEVAGKVVEVAIEEHDVVDEGALLVRLDPALIEAARQRAAASSALAQATLRQSIAELRRQRDLAERGIASEVELERTETEERTARARVAEARAQESEAATRLAKTRITAPFAAVVNSFDLEPGAYLAPGNPVAELIDLSEIELEVGVGDRQITALREGAKVRVTVDVHAGENFAGTIHRLGRAPDSQTRRYPVPIRIANPGGRLLPGMLATAHFELGSDRPVLRIPRSAIFREFEIDYVFALTEDPGEPNRATVERRSVKVSPVPFRPDLLEVESGVEEGERLAISGLKNLVSGAAVRYRERGADR